MVRESTHLLLTARGAGALSGGFLLVLLAFFTANLLVYLVALLVLAIVLAELIAFAVATVGFGPGAFEARRVESSSFVGVGGYGFASVEVTSRLPGSFFVELTDRCPERLARVEGDAHLVSWWDPGETLVLAYVVSPRIRGYFDLGPTVVTAHDGFGLAVRSVALEVPWQIEAVAVPTGQGVAHPERLESGVVGQTWLAVRGSGSDFHSLREYEPGDEVRHIAWARSARGELFVRQYERESQQDLIVLLDIGRDMVLGLGYDDALEKSVAAAGAVLRLGFSEGGRCGAALFTSRLVAFEPAGRGWAHEFRTFRTLTRAAVSDEESSLAEALLLLAPRLHRPTSLLIFSSLAGDPSRLASACGALRHAGHRVYALVADVEAMFPPLTDPTDARAFQLVAGPDVHRAHAAAEALARAGALVARFGRAGAIDAVNRLYAGWRLGPEAM